jgi:uncharacterized protein YggU (UPF0235/DUF167 family)
VVELVARTFGIAKRDVTINAGEQARLKRLLITGDAAALEKIAAAL